MANGKKTSRQFPAKDPGCDPVQRKWGSGGAGLGSVAGKGAGLNGKFGGAKKSGKP